MWSLSHVVKLMLAILEQEWLPAIFPLPALVRPEVILCYECDLMHWALEVREYERRNKFSKV